MSKRWLRCLPWRRRLSGLRGRRLGGALMRPRRNWRMRSMGFENLGRELWPIALFAFIILLLGVNRYRQTLD
jgi:hypothetical protein